MRIYCDSFVFLSRVRTDRTSMIYWMKLILNLNIPHIWFSAALSGFEIYGDLQRSKEEFFRQKCDISRKDQNNFTVVECDEMQKRANARLQCQAAKKSNFYDD